MFYISNQNNIKISVLRWVGARPHIMVPHGLNWHVTTCNGILIGFSWEILPHTFLGVTRSFMKFYDRFE